MPSLTPQRRVPRALTSARVAPAQEGDVTHAPARPTSAATKSGRAPARVLGRGMRGIIADRDDWIQRKAASRSGGFPASPTCGNMWGDVIAITERQHRRTIAMSAGETPRLQDRSAVVQQDL